MTYFLILTLLASHGGAAYFGYKKGSAVANEVAKAKAAKDAALNAVNKA